MKTKAIIFDLDGTLLYTVEDIANASNKALQLYGFPVHPIDDYRKMVGHGLTNLVEKALPEKSDPSDVDKVFKELVKQYHLAPANHTRPYQGIPEMLDQITAESLRLAILSNKLDSLTRKITENLLGQWSFEVVFGAREGVAKKPDPASAIEIASIMKLQANQITFVGDSGTDIRTALAAGFYPVGVSWGYRSIEDLRSAGAEKIIHHPDQLYSQLE